jgi:hypothetical protein
MLISDTLRGFPTLALGMFILFECCRRDNKIMVLLPCISLGFGIVCENSCSHFLVVRNVRDSLTVQIVLTMEMYSDTCESLAVHIVLPWKCIATRVNLWQCRLCYHGNV